MKLNKALVKIGGRRLHKGIKNLEKKKFCFIFLFFSENKYKSVGSPL